MEVGPDGYRLAPNNTSKTNKLEWLSGHDQNETCRTFVINDENHTLGNVLKHYIIQNPEVEFCSYTVPHPMEQKIHLRIQTRSVPAVLTLQKALLQIRDLNNSVKEMIAEDLTRFKDGIET